MLQHGQLSIQGPGCSPGGSVITGSLNPFGSLKCVVDYSGARKLI